MDEWMDGSIYEWVIGLLNHIDGGREEHTTTKFPKISKIFLRRRLTQKILKKFTEVYFFTVNYNEFFQNFWSQCAS